MRHDSHHTQWTLGHVPAGDVVAPELVLTFFPRSFTVRWSLCSTTADFCADYLAELDVCRRSRDAINYVLNELVENAVKFSEGETITISLAIDADALVLVVANYVGDATARSLHTRLGELLADDPLELLMRRVEENAENPERESSGLGFLTMMTDYEALLGWRLSQGSDGSPPLLSTIARLDISRG